MKFPFIINYKTLFIITTLRGTLITISSDSWWTGWLGMEINLIGFIAILTRVHNNESTFKYFIIQAIGSIIMIRRMLTSTINSRTYTILLNTALLLKIGAAPLHYWLPMVIESLNKLQCVIILTWQKIAPLYLLLYTPQNKIIWLFVVTRLIIGAARSINELRVFTLMAYSSINHTGWMLLTIIINEIITVVYILVYTLLLLIIINSVNKKFILNQWLIGNRHKLIIFINLLSLGGLPPFTGFIIKWLTLTEIYKFSYILINRVLITTRIILIYFYIRISVRRFLSNKMLIISNRTKNRKFLINISVIVNLPLLYIIICTSSIKVHLAFN